MSQYITTDYDVYDAKDTKVESGIVIFNKLTDHNCVSPRFVRVGSIESTRIEPNGYLSKLHILTKSEDVIVEGDFHQLVVLTKDITEAVRRDNSETGQEGPPDKTRLQLQTEQIAWAVFIAAGFQLVAHDIGSRGFSTGEEVKQAEHMANKLLEKLRERF